MSERYEHEWRMSPTGMDDVSRCAHCGAKQGQAYSRDCVVRLRAALTAAEAERLQYITANSEVGALNVELATRLTAAEAQRDRYRAALKWEPNRQGGEIGYCPTCGIMCIEEADAGRPGGSKPPAGPFDPNLPGFFAGETCPHCRNGKLTEDSERLGLVCPECGGAVRAVQLGDYPGQD